MKRREFMKTGIAASALGMAFRAGAGKDKQSMDTISVAAVQLYGYDKMGAIKPGIDPVAALLPYIEQAGADKTDLLVFPEYHLGRIRIPGAETKRIGDAVRQQGIHVIVGSWELLEDSSYANAALLFGRDGNIVGKYYKTHAAVDGFDADQKPYTAPPSGHEQQWFIKNDPEWTMQRGEELPVFELDFGRIGILTCYDGWFPEPWRILSLKGAEIIVWINGRAGRVEDYIVKSAMFQNEVHIITANQAYGAGTMIGQYHNRILAHTEETGAEAIRAKLNMKMLRDVRAHSRNFAQRRPELYDILSRQEMDTERYTGLQKF
ncbi:MAG: carbon-nitrogen hydrolase family protein [Candidatus Hydrogenedentes bacterium]|nr:carbon-nitrogen hydrolase family protein [Candidatus Hydrogenedentota bacterium]